mmetsp:Transcript_19521/g.45385  ORF Transcript_19521/g.45385 Transcript_19521/m.45385 type:complete len:275 (-) Transcript_19521:61-885(-)
MALVWTRVFLLLLFIFLLQAHVIVDDCRSGWILACVFIDHCRSGWGQHCHCLFVDHCRSGWGLHWHCLFVHHCVGFCRGQCDHQPKCGNLIVHDGLLRLVGLLGLLVLFNFSIHHRWKLTIEDHMHPCWQAPSPRNASGMSLAEVPQRQPQPPRHALSPVRLVLVILPKPATLLTSNSTACMVQCLLHPQLGHRLHPCHLHNFVQELILRGHGLEVDGRLRLVLIVLEEVRMVDVLHLEADNLTQLICSSIISTPFLLYSGRCCRRPSFHCTCE